MYLKREDGAAAVEFAILLPLLMMILFGIIEFGLVLYRQEIITNASREGARYGIVISSPRPTTGEIEDVVNTYLTNAGLNAGDATIEVTPPPVMSSGSDLTVRVVYPYNFLVLPNFAASLIGTLNLNARTVMKLE